VHEADAEHRTRPLERSGNVRAAVIRVQDLGHTAALDGRAQHLLAGARVLLGHPHAVQHQS
jgi:hypothetical protein